MSYVFNLCISGSPFHFTVIDASQVKAVGDGLGLVPCNRSATFSIHAPGARAHDLTINILGKVINRDVWARNKHH